MSLLKSNAHIDAVKEPMAKVNHTIAAVIFDLDDTLYDEVEYCKSGFWACAEFLNETLEDISPEDIFNTFWEQFCTGNQTRTFNGALEKLDIPYNDELIEELIRTYRNHTPQITLPQDSLDVLKSLKKKYKLALLTDGFLPAQQLKVRALKIEKFFDSIVYTEELGREFWKPSPAGFEKILHTLKIKAENAVYVADNEKKDFIGPIQLGMMTIHLIRDAHLQPAGCQKSCFSARYMLKKISRLPELLEQICIE